MKEFAVIEFFEDTEIKDDTYFAGPSTVQGSFTAFSVESKDNFTVKNDLLSTKGVINASCDLQVGGNLISSGDIIVRKDCVVGGYIKGANISLLGVNASAQSIKATTLRVRGNINIENDIIALQSISVFLNLRRRKVIIGGTIEAPQVVVIFSGFFTKWSTLLDSMFKIVGREVRVKKLFSIGNLNIKTDKLTIKTHYPPSRVEIDYSQSHVETNEIEILRLSESDIR